MKNWNVFHQHHRDRQFLHDVNFNVRAGEVVGIAGLMGAGRTETAMSIFGRSWGHKITGEVLMHGKPVDVSTIPQAPSTPALPMSPKTASSSASC